MDLGRYISERFISNLTAEMTQHDRIASGRSLKALKVIDDGRIVKVVDGTANQYWEYIDKGRAWKAGRRPPIAPILAWVKVKLKITEFKEALRSAWAIAVNIGQHGAPKNRASLGLIDRAAIKTTEEIRPELLKYHTSLLDAAMRGELKL